MFYAKNDDEIEEKVLQLAKNILDYVEKASAGSTSSKVIAFSLTICFILATGAVFFKALSSALEHVAKIIESYKNSSFKIVFSGEKKKIIRRRKQFCAVLDADLAYLAKSESWNDQYFTDLEAEVEIEGGYYTSALDKIRKRRSYGVRKVASLMDAIETSIERAILLVGEPGSGKSVALRHLAKQIAEKGKKSNNIKAVIPLYLNLRELDVQSGISINADLIRQFVLENIRRGDADTSAFVQDNWSKNKDEGTWLFLFDSFDEIPAVLHAASGSAAVREYSSAIREFLDGMGECRSILASREYKGPEALPWKKFRILPLDREKQRQLVDNSFLDDDKKRLVNQHLVVERSTLGNNPLFLTLLCRFVKDVGTQPSNDHQLLTSHLERLSSREPEYILRRYNLTGSQLMDGAQKLALLLATNPALSLSPRLDEIFSAMGAVGPSLDELQNLISALVDVKIGRTDVATARHGDRRFAFSHRRYQETLFANFLAANPNFICASDLLLRPEWRDYAVTLLQTQDIGDIEEMLNEAAKLLSEKADAQAATPAKYMSELGVGYFKWNDESLVSILMILQEGMARRLSDIPAVLSDSIDKILSPRWLYGDHLDRYMVIKLGGLLPQAILADYLSSSLSDRRPQVAAIAFKQCVFLQQTSEKINKLICKKLASETLGADKTVVKLRLEALAARLPASVGASFVFQRCVKLRPVLSKLSIASWIVLSPNLVFLKLFQLIPVSSEIREKLNKNHPSLIYQGGRDWVIGIMLPLLMLGSHGIVKILNLSKKNQPDPLERLISDIVGSIYFMPLLLLYMVVVISIIALYRLRDEGNALSLSLLISPTRFRSWMSEAQSIARGIFVLASASLVPLILGHGVKLLMTLFGYEISVKSVYVEIGIPCLVVLVLITATLLFLYDIKEGRAKSESFKKAKCISSDDCLMLLTANSFDLADAWLDRYSTFLAEEEDARSASAIFARFGQIKQMVGAERYPLMKGAESRTSYSGLCDKIARRALAFEENI